MEILQFNYDQGTVEFCAGAVLAGVVSSGNLEILVEPVALHGACEIIVNTPASGFAQIWKAVLDHFHTRHPLRNARISINDMGATPAVVSLRLEQAMLDAAASTGMSS